ncbi:conserved hypothetical protein [Paraburkholderia piptadeniae]|uniref:Uncharacterized protein n=1 Tax=Paraburkholderia piptadeniae TaxID=1701573 RepID=A0A1N7SXV4_9BURK|nr:hypothetical protein [Paraburkholderia piptadeniae]SIT52252.1 conserved hypothetical protein [Paraburkholderia piptadeniae]
METVNPELIARLVRINPVVIVNGETSRSLRYHGKRNVRALMGFLGTYRDMRALVYSHSASGRQMWLDVQPGRVSQLPVPVPN